MQLGAVQGCTGGGGGGGLTRAVTPSGRILFDNFMCALFVRVCVCAAIAGKTSCKRCSRR